MPSIKTILTIVVVTALVLWLTAKMDESRAKNGKKLIFNPNI